MPDIFSRGNLDRVGDANTQLNSANTLTDTGIASGNPEQAALGNTLKSIQNQRFQNALADQGRDLDNVGKSQQLADKGKG